MRCVAFYGFAYRDEISIYALEQWSRSVPQRDFVLPSRDHCLSRTEKQTYDPGSPLIQSTFAKEVFVLRHAAGLSLLVITLAACADGTVTAPPSDIEVSASKGGSGPARSHFRRLRGRCATTFTFTSPPGLPAQQLHIDGECVFAPIGPLTLSADQTVVFNPDGSSTITNTATYTARNGDQLRASFLGTGSQPDEMGNVCFEGTETYSGGTGRFTDATGSATVDGCASLPRQRGFFTVDGTIRF
jgi:hypothetical protein